MRAGSWNRRIRKGYFSAKESIRRTENRQKVIAEGDFLDREEDDYGGENKDSAG